MQETNLRYGDFKCSPKIDVESLYLVFQSAHKVLPDTDFFSRALFLTAMDLLNPVEKVHYELEEKKEFIKQYTGNVERIRQEKEDAEQDEQKPLIHEQKAKKVNKRQKSGGQTINFSKWTKIAEAIKKGTKPCKAYFEVMGHHLSQKNIITMLTKHNLLPPNFNYQPGKNFKRLVTEEGESAGYGRIIPKSEKKEKICTMCDKNPANGEDDMCSECRKNWNDKRC